jgi:hypothetical protein
VARTAPAAQRSSFRRIRALAIQQIAFSLDTPTIAGETAIVAYRTMTRNRHSYRVRRARVRHCAHRAALPCHRPLKARAVQWREAEKVFGKAYSPSASVNRGANARATISTDPPGGNATTMRIERTGYSCARLEIEHTAADALKAGTIRIRRFMVLPPAGYSSFDPTHESG